MSVIGELTVPVTPVTETWWDMYQTHRRWWTVADAARLLRVHTDTLYDACAADDFPHERWDGQIRIPCEALRMTYVPTAETLALQRRLRATAQNLPDPDQLSLDLPPSMLMPGHLYRNGERKRAFDHERALWGHNKAV